MAAANKARGGEGGRRAPRAAEHVHLVEEPIGEGLSAPAGPGKAMAQTFLREPVRLVHLARIVLGLLARDPVTLPRVTAQDVGGAFGVKVLPTREDVAVLAAAVDLGRSVKWIEDRNEHLLIAGQAREETLDVEAALRDDGTLLGMRVAHDDGPGRVPGVPVQRRDVPADDPHDDAGARTGCPRSRSRTTMTASNKATYVAYRGPWAVETWVRERMLDLAARDLGIGRDEIRLRNIIGPDELPAEDAHRSDARRAHVGAHDARARARARRPRELAGEAGRGPRRGAVRRARASPPSSRPRPGRPTSRSRSCRAGAGGSWPASRRGSVLEADGTVSVFTQQMPHGQGHETTLAQVAADELGVPIEQVRVRFGDTAITPFGLVGHRRQPLGADGRGRRHLLGTRAPRPGARRRRRPARGAARRPRRRRRQRPRRRACRRSR